MFKKGTVVRQIVPVIEGEINQTRFNEDAQQLEYHVSFKDAAGESHARWFLESELVDPKAKAKAKDEKAKDEKAES